MIKNVLVKVYTLYKKNKLPIPNEEFITKHNLKNPEEIRAAAIKFVLSNPRVNTACCSLQTYEEMERILPLSGKKLTHT